MTTLMLFKYLGKNVRTNVFQQITQSQKSYYACTPASCWNNAKNYTVLRTEKHITTHTHNRNVLPSPPLLRIQSLAVLNHNRIYDQKRFISNRNRSETKSPAAITNEELFGESSKLGLFAKFKLMYKKYWYVLIPVHIVTSLGWFAGFYYLSQSGVDIPALLHQLHVSETIIEKVKNSSMGHVAIAYLFYKIATPVRYAVTLGGTTITIKYLVQTGYIKPVPSKQEMMDMYEQKMADLARNKDKKT